MTQLALMMLITQPKPSQRPADVGCVAIQTQLRLRALSSSTCMRMRRPNVNTIQSSRHRCCAAGSLLMAESVI